jgi:hypothetical protein
MLSICNDWPCPEEWQQLYWLSRYVMAAVSSCSVVHAAVSLVVTIDTSHYYTCTGLGVNVLYNIYRSEAGSVP